MEEAGGQHDDGVRAVAARDVRRRRERPAGRGTWNVAVVTLLGPSPRVRPLARRGRESVFGLGDVARVEGGASVAAPASYGWPRRHPRSIRRRRAWRRPSRWRWRAVGGSRRPSPRYRDEHPRPRAPPKKTTPQWRRRRAASWAAPQAPPVPSSTERSNPESSADFARQRMHSSTQNWSEEDNSDMRGTT